MRAVRAEAGEADALRSLLGRPLDEIRAEDLSWLPPDERTATERAGYLEVVLHAGDAAVSIHAEEFLTPKPYPRCKLYRPAALVVGSDAHARWREELQGRARRAKSGAERTRIERHLTAPDATLARNLGAIAEARQLKTLFWPRKRDRDEPDFEWRFLSPRDEHALEVAAAETAQLELDVAITEYDIGVGVTTTEGHEVVASAEKFVLLALDQGLGRFGGVAVPEPL